MGRRSSGLITTLAALALAACNPQSAPTSESGLETTQVTVVSKSGSHVLDAEVADTQEAQAKGLEGRDGLGPNEAMLFPNSEQTAQVFWTKDSTFPVDIVFIGVDGRVSNIVAMAEPNSPKQYFSVGSSSATLEMAGGRAAELGIEPGDQVSW